MHFNPSEWMEFFDPKVGMYRQRHVGSGIVQDSLFSPEPVYAKPQKTTKKEPEANEKPPEKGHIKIQQMLNTNPQSKASWQLGKILTKQV